MFFIKKCSPKLLFSTEIFLSKILGIFNLEIILKSQILALFWQGLAPKIYKKNMIKLLVICNTSVQFWLPILDLFYPELL